MIRKKGPRVNKLDVSLQWTKKFASTVYRFTYLYTGNITEAAAISEQTFAYAYRRMDLSHLFLSEANTVFAAVVAACRGGQRVDGEHQEREAAKTADEGPADKRQEPENTDREDKGELAKADAAEPWLVKLQQLSQEARLLILLRTVAGRESADLSRILLVPRRLVQTRIEAAWVELQRGAGSAYLLPEGGPTDANVQMLTAELDSTASQNAISDEMRMRIWKIVKATAQEVDAQRRHRGPGWLTYGVVLMGVFSVAAIDVGVHRSVSTAATATNSVGHGVRTTGVQNPFVNLPVTTKAQFTLNKMPGQTQLSHVVVQRDDVYFPVLEQSADAWPSIHIQAAPLSATGKALDQVLVTAGSIPMVPPITSDSSTSGSWKISDWNLDISDTWAFATVEWGQSSGLSVVTQIYALSLPSGKSGLVKTLDNHHTGSVVVAVGNGHVVIQDGVQNVQTNVPAGGGQPNQTSSGQQTNVGGASNRVAGTKVAVGSSSQSGQPANDQTSVNMSGNVVGLPVDVYQISGKNPLQSLVPGNRIPAPFGLMANPRIFSSGIFFTAIEGSQTDTSGKNMRWYLLSWNGDLSQFVGPPDDGQNHWAVIGSSDDMWWVETTPNPNGTSVNAWQVLMAPLSAQTAAVQAPALSLSGAVAWFSAYNSNVAWIQNNDGRLQLVVSSVQ